MWPVQVVEEEEEEQLLSWLGCLTWLTLVTVFISLLSDYIMEAITGACASTGRGRGGVMGR